MTRATWLTLLLIPVIAHADALDDLVTSRMETEHVPGVCVAIVPPEGEPTVRSSGMSNLELKTPYSADTVHRIASLSKQFCAYAVLLLDKQGKLSKQDSLRKHFPEGPAEWDGVSIAQVLAHRSGIPDVGADFEYTQDYTGAEYVKLLASKPLAETPGTKYRYNNFAYALLGVLVERVSGKPLSQVVTENIFDPIGMANSRYFKESDLIQNRSDAYVWRDGAFVNARYDRPEVFAGSGGILTTMNDFLKYESALREKKVLDPAILDYQWNPFPGGDYGAGWHISVRDGVKWLMHTGESFGFTSAFLRVPEQKWSVIVFRNASVKDSMKWAVDILATVRKSSLTSPTKTAPRSPSSEFGAGSATASIEPCHAPFRDTP